MQNWSISWADINSKNSILSCENRIPAPVRTGRLLDHYLTKFRGQPSRFTGHSQLITIPITGPANNSPPQFRCKLNGVLRRRTAYILTWAPKTTFSYVLKSSRAFAFRLMCFTFLVPREELYGDRDANLRTFLLESLFKERFFSPSSFLYSPNLFRQTAGCPMSWGSVVDGGHRKIIRI